MNFFEQQDAARRHTTRLVLLFVLAVVAIVVAVNIVSALAFIGISSDLETGGVRIKVATDSPSIIMRMACSSITSRTSDSTVWRRTT